jgi:hypothetical protein
MADKFITKEQLLEFAHQLDQAMAKRWKFGKIRTLASGAVDLSAVDQRIAEAISLLKGEDLPQDSDTLKELADKIVANAVNDTVVLNQAKAYTDDKTAEVLDTAKAYTDASIANFQTTLEVPTQAEVDFIFGISRANPILDANPMFYYPLETNLDPVGNTSATITSSGVFVTDSQEGPVTEVTNAPGIDVTVESSVNAYTVTCRVKLVTNGGIADILKAAADDGDSLKLTLFNGNLEFGNETGSDSVSVSILDNWVTIHLVYTDIDKGGNEGDGLLYVDGTLHTTFSGCWVDENQSLIHSVRAAYISEEGSTIRIKNLALFDRALTPEEIQAQAQG